MLVASRTLALGALLALFSLCSCCHHHVTPHPNVGIRQTEGHALRLRNASPAALTLLSPPSAPAPSRLVLAPGEQTELPFTLLETTNRSPAGEFEILPVPEATSPLLGWSVRDLTLRVQFAGQDPELIRIRTDRCLFESSAPQLHDWLLAAPPLPGIPALRLCE